MIAIRNFSSLIRLRPKLVHPASGWLALLLLWPVGLAGQETGQVTLYTPDGSQQRTLSVPLVVNVDVGLPSPMEAPTSAVIGTGTGTRRTDVEVVVSDSAGGQATTSYAHKRIWALAADTSGNVWVATSRGLSRFDGQQWTTFTQADGLASDWISSLAVDGQDQVWAWSPGGGATRFDGQRWTRYWFEGMQGDRIAVAPNGDVWCAGYHNFLLARFDGQDWWTYNHSDIGTIGSEERFDNAYFANIAVDQSGTLWAVAGFAKASAKRTDGSISETWTRLLSFNGTQWSAYQPSFGMIFPDSEGRVWMSCAEGLCVKDGSMWKRYDAVGIGRDERWRVQAMMEDAAGRLWITDHHFGMLEGTTWTGWPRREFIAVPNVPMVFDNRGDLWVVASYGLYRWHRLYLPLPTAIESSSISAEPRSFHLEQNYPNPFNHATHIGFTLQQPTAVTLQVFNIHGQLVATLVEGSRPAGTYQTAWGGHNDQGQAVSSGIYIVRLDAAGQQASRKMILIQ